MANRNKAKKIASDGATAKEIRKETGVKAPAARNIVSRAAARASTPSPAPAPAPTPARTTPEAKNLGQGLRIAGGGGGIGRKDLILLQVLGKMK